MIPATYFDRTDTPTKYSPIARIMRQLDAIYPDLSAEELRAIANRRIHSSGPKKVKWTCEERKRLKEAGVLPGGEEAERFSRSRSVLGRDDSFPAPTRAANDISTQEVR